MTDCACDAVSFEARLALEDVRRVVCRYGTNINFHGMPTLPTIGGEPLIGEGNQVTKDKYGSTINRNLTPVIFKSYPVDHSPSTKQLHAVGMTEQMDILLYLSTKEVELKGYSFDSFDTLKVSAIVGNVEYKIKDRKKHSQFKDTYLYIALGLRRN